EGGIWRKYSPSRLLFDRVFQWCIAQKLKIYDFGIGDEDYKDEYCDRSISLYEASIPTSTKGFIFLYWKLIRDRIHERRARSRRETEYAENLCDDISQLPRAAAHACRSLLLWPSPRRLGKFLIMMKKLAERR